MYLPFEKWHAARNDFIVVYQTSPTEMVMSALRGAAPSLCDRRTGIGADGILVLIRDNAMAVLPRALTIINSDGSSASMCGNGLRCAAGSVLRLWREKGNPREPIDTVTLDLADRVVTCRVLGPGTNATPMLAVDLGVATVSSKLSWWSDAQSEVARVRASVPDLPNDFGACEIGNRHLVFWTDDASADHARRFGPPFQRSTHWDGINVHIAQAIEIDPRDNARLKRTLGRPIGDAFQVFPWERGAGETPACGSGAASVAAIAACGDFSTPDSWTLIRMPGGDLYARRDDTTGHMTLAGDATLVFTGTLEL